MRPLKFRSPKPEVSLHQPIGDSVHKTTCYMCACRCGIDVHLRDGLVRYIQGNRDHPVNKGVLCAKGSAGIMQHYSPARLKKPLLRTGERGKSEFKEIEWEEALTIATKWMGDVRNTNPKKLAFFTGRDQSQSLTGWWAQQFGTPNYSAHGGFCSVNMAAAGIYTIGGSFWEFGSPDWERTKLFVMFGVAEDHDSNPIKLGISRLKARGARFVSVNPVRTGYSAVADDWIGIKPGTDGLLVHALIHELLNNQTIDVDYLVRYSNAPWLVINAPGTAKDGLFARDSEGNALVWDRATNSARSHKDPGIKPELMKSFTLENGISVRPAFAAIAEHYLDKAFSPSTVSNQIGVEENVISSLAREMGRVAFEQEIRIEKKWTDHKGEEHDHFIGRPVSMHAMRGISAHSNGFQTCRAIHLLQVLLGSVDCPGGFRFKAPYPKPAEGHPRPGGKSFDGTPNKPLDGPQLGYVLDPEDLLVDDAGLPLRIDKAFSWEFPLAPHGMMHMVIANAYAGDPYPIDVLFLYMANMAWNSSMNTRKVIDMLTERNKETGEYVIPKIIYSDAYASEMVAYADLILPDTTYLERHDCISLLDRPICEPDAVADAIRWPIVEPNRDVRGFQSVLIDLGARLNLPGFVTETGEAKYSNYADYLVNHERRPGVGPLMGWRGADGKSQGRGAPNPNQLEEYKNNGSFCETHLPENARFFKFSNMDYQNFAIEHGLIDKPQPTTLQIYLEPLQKFRLAAMGFGSKQPPAHVRSRIAEYFSPIPIWYKPLEQTEPDNHEYPIFALTQRPMAMYHSWGSQNAWLRQIHTWNPMYIPANLCDQLDLNDGDWAWIISRTGKIRVMVKRMTGVNKDTIWTWNAIGKRKEAWGLSTDSPESRKGFLLNHLISELLPNTRDRLSNSDPITGQAAWFDLKVRIEKDIDSSPADTFFDSSFEPGRSAPQFDPIGSPPGTPARPDVSDFGKQWRPSR